MSQLEGPLWTTTDFKKISGEDHLGIKYVSVSISDRLQSGITTITPRARYWSFFTWVLHDFIQQNKGLQNKDLSINAFREYLKRQEWYFILANIAEGEVKGAMPSGLMGVTKGRKLWDSNDNSIQCQYDYLANSFGGYSIYGNVIKILGLIRTGDIEKGIEIDRITPTGLRLAKAFKDEISGTEYYNKWRYSDKPVPKEVLLEYGNKASLSNLNPDSKDLPILKEIFLQDDAKEENHLLRTLSLKYYIEIIKTRGLVNNRKIWRKIMYDQLSPRGEASVLINRELRNVAIGWEIFHGRQIFTFSLETIWSYMLEVLARHSYSEKDLVDKLLNDLGINLLDRKIQSIITELPLDIGSREDFVVKMRKQGGTSIEYILNPLLVMLDVYYRFLDRDDFTELHDELMNYGENDNISLKKWARDVERFASGSVKEFLEYIIRYYVIKQHQKVALNKVLTTKNETYHFSENNGLLFHIKSDTPSFSALRIEQGVSILKDLCLIS